MSEARRLRTFETENARLKRLLAEAMLDDAVLKDVASKMVTRLLGQWMRIMTISNQSSVAKAFQEFDEMGRMKPSAYYERICGNDGGAGALHRPVWLLGVD